MGSERVRDSGVRVRAAVACAAFVVALFTPLGPAATGQVACAAEEGPRAALVVDTGGSVYRLCVRLDAARVSGLHLIELASSQYGLTYRFGEGGQAVCMLANVGATGDDCFGQHPYFWGFWTGNGSGGWAWAGSGAGSVGVSDGGIHGWSWDTGDGPATHRPPPRTTHASVCPPPQEPDPSRPPASTPAGGGGPSGSDGGDEGVAPKAAQLAPAGAGSREGNDRTRSGKRSGTKDEEGRSGRRHDKKKRDADEPDASADPSSSATSAAGAGPPLPEAPEGSGPPPAGVAALGASAALAGAGVLLARRRRTNAR